MIAPYGGKLVNLLVVDDGERRDLVGMAALLPTPPSAFPMAWLWMPMAPSLLRIRATIALGR